MTLALAIQCSYYRRVWIRFPVLVAVLCLGVGCAVSPTHKELAPANVPHEVVANWSDTDAAVEVALHQMQMAKDHEEISPDELERRYYLVTITDEPARLTLRRDSLSDQPQLIRLEANVGRFGDPVRETHLVRAVRHRLKALVGVTHAPVTPPS